MIKSEKVLMFLLISICLLVSIILVDALVDPADLIATVFASNEKPSEIISEENIMPAPEEITLMLEDGWEVFRSEGYAFEIQFPNIVVKKSLVNQNVLNTGIGVSSDAPVWEFKLDDPSLYQGTNLMDASLVIHVLQGEEEVAACSQFQPGSLSTTGQEKSELPPVVEINGHSYWKDEVIEGVMGEFYQKISYRTVSKGACYQLTQLIHYQNIESVSPDEISDFNKEEVIARLDTVMGTFTLLDIVPTFPKQSYPAPKLVSPAVSKSASDNVDGLDVSHWQGDINWYKVDNNGYVFTFVKATEGVGWLDVKFLENINEGTAAGVVMGAYHFARPTYGHTGAEEAEYFLSQVGDYLESGYLRPVLDLEVGSKLGREALSAWVLDWLSTVKNRTGVSPLIYTNLNYVNNYFTNELTEYDLWIAYWNCDPSPTFDIPPTGRWGDWAFWQYCVGDAGTVPGISTRIDMNIFNGVEEGLGEYDASSPLWVSISNYTVIGPAPHYADITADVNGDTTGPINYALWWDCSELGSDYAQVSAVCGPLPAPVSGQCLKNENGMRCLQAASEVILGEHTYQEIGDFTAKVIVERGEASPAEDRFKITTYNPIRSTSIDPPSPANGIVNDPFPLSGAVDIRTSVMGALQVSVVEQGSGEIKNSDCQSVAGDLKIPQGFNLSWTESSPGGKQYEIWTRYRALGGCPITDAQTADLSQTYQVNWEAVNPVLELKSPEGTPIPAGSTDEMGNREPYQTMERGYLIFNSSTTNSLQITGSAIENPVNVLNPQLDLSGTIVVGPGEEKTITVSFEIENTGPFSFNLSLEHDASNPSPYTFSVQGNGVMAINPIQVVSPHPVSPRQKMIGEPYPLQIDVQIDAPVPGVLQVSLVDPGGGLVDDSLCQVIASAGQSQHTFDFTWTESGPGVQDYTIWTRYRGRAVCPIEDTQTIDLSQNYQVNWQEDSPILELQRSDGTLLPAGENINIGQYEYYQSVNLNYLIHNTSTTSQMRVADIRIDNLVNLNQVNVIPSGPSVLNPGENQTLAITFLVGNTGPFSFDLIMDHEAINPSPYRVTIEGKGVMTNNPINYVVSTPSSPGTSLIGTGFQIGVEVGIDLPDDGSLQVSLVEQGTGVVRDQECQVIVDNLNSTRNFNLSWTNTVPGVVDYTLWTRYRVQGECPVEDELDSDFSQSYRVTWEEDIPVLELQYPGGPHLPASSNDDIRQVEFYEQVNLEYMIHNTSTTSSMQISLISAENLINLSQVNLNTSGPITVGPEGQYTLSGSFLVKNTGPFAFDLKLDHNASNTSPYRITVQGVGVMTTNPIQSLSTEPSSPGTSLISNPFQLKVDVGNNAPAPGALEVSLMDQGSGSFIDQTCVSNLGVGQSTMDFGFSWTNEKPGDEDYTIQAIYQAEGTCPIVGDHDAELSEVYRVSWWEERPVLEVKRPLGVSIFDGAVDYIGEHDFFRFVEVTYVIKNETAASLMNIENIYAENLVNLRNVTAEPAGPFEIGPGETKTIIISFQILTLEPYSFDLLWEHDASNPSPYQFVIQGDANLYLGDTPVDSWLYDYVESLISEEFFLNAPQWVLDTILEVLINS